MTWDPVLGASGYEVEVRLFTGGGCTAAVGNEYWDDTVATNAWTPLGPNPADEPWPNHGRPLAQDGAQRSRRRPLCTASASARTPIRPSTRTTSSTTSSATGRTSTTACDPERRGSGLVRVLRLPGRHVVHRRPARLTCSAAYPQDGDYLLPQSGSTPTTRRTSRGTRRRGRRATSCSCRATRTSRRSSTTPGSAGRPTRRGSASTPRATRTRRPATTGSCCRRRTRTASTPGRTRCSRTRRSSTKEAAPPAPVAPTGGTAVVAAPDLRRGASRTGRGRTPSRSRPTRCSPTSSRPSRPPRAPTRRRTATRPTRASTGASAPTTGTTSRLTWSPSQQFQLARIGADAVADEPRGLGARADVGVVARPGRRLVRRRGPVPERHQDAVQGLPHDAR